MCNRPKCKEARKKAAALKAGRGGVPAPSDTSQQEASPAAAPATSANGVIVSTNNKKGIVQ